MKEVILYDLKCCLKPRRHVLFHIPIIPLNRGRKRVNLEWSLVDSPPRGEDNQRNRGISFQIAFQNIRVLGPAMLGLTLGSVGRCF